ncbi:TatD family hydrolase [Rothia sp. AR01]|uniref:TatD family hydrolase n=1 Tax=Rothia santali TaxID=2949643 RepID=A0A9X2HFY2_9MICC|nr:TatD family hydrolase [Rothia santali]MCP3427002.1 TatD family hydrolase [Rothia santali]
MCISPDRTWRDLAPDAAELLATLWPDPATRPGVVPGEVPPAYEPERYATADEASGPGTRRRSSSGEDGRSRNLVFPKAPEPLPEAIADNHTHMDLLDGDVAVSARDALDTGAALGVGAVVQVGCDLPSSAYAVAAAEADPRVLAAVAIHPNEAPALAAAGELDAALEALAEMAGSPRVRAIGETGLDYFRTPEEGREAQRESFRRHIRLAHATGLALQIHDRDAHDDVVAILDEEGAPERTVFHCYSGGPELAEICNARGWRMSFAGTVTFKNSRDIQASLEIARPELILAETDAPFLTPHPFRGRPNASYMTNYTVRYMAQRRGEDLAGLCRTIRENSVAVYGSWGLPGFGE